MAGRELSLSRGAGIMFVTYGDAMLDDRSKLYFFDGREYILHSMKSNGLNPLMITGNETIDGLEVGLSVFCN